MPAAPRAGVLHPAKREGNVAAADFVKAAGGSAVFFGEGGLSYNFSHGIE